MKYFLSFLFLSLSSLVYAQSDYRLTEHNLKFKFLYDSSGTTARVGDLVSLQMIMEAPNGKVLRNTYSEGKPLLFPVKVPAFEGDLYEAVALLSAGDSAAFLIPADSMYQKVFRKPLPDESMSGKDMKFTIKAIEISSQEEYLKAQQQKRNAFDKEHQKEIAQHKKQDDQFLKSYFEKNYAGNYSITDKGVYYALYDKGKGAKPKAGETVVFHYVCKNKNGEKIESSYDGAGHPAYFVKGQNQVIPGWEDVFQYLQQGSYAIVGVPSDMAYGPLSKGDKIPPYSILFFEIKFVSVK